MRFGYVSTIPQFLPHREVIVYSTATHSSRVYYNDDVHNYVNISIPLVVVITIAIERADPPQQTDIKRTAHERK